jgi:hypothetical protein
MTVTNILWRLLPAVARGVFVRQKITKLILFWQPRLLARCAVEYDNVKWTCKRLYSPSGSPLYLCTTIYEQSLVITPKVLVQWLTLLLRIRKVPGSNLGPETGYHYLGFSWFYSVLPGEWRDSISKIRSRLLPSKSSFSYHSATRRCMAWAAESKVE